MIEMNHAYAHVPGILRKKGNLIQWGVWQYGKILFADWQLEMWEEGISQASQKQKFLVAGSKLFSGSRALLESHIENLDSIKDGSSINASSGNCKMRPLVVSV